MTAKKPRLISAVAHLDAKPRKRATSQAAAYRQATTEQLAEENRRIDRARHAEPGGDKRCK